MSSLQREGDLNPCGCCSDQCHLRLCNLRPWPSPVLIGPLRWFAVSHWSTLQQAVKRKVKWKEKCGSGSSSLCLTRCGSAWITLLIYAANPGPLNIRTLRGVNIAGCALEQFGWSACCLKVQQWHSILDFMGAPT